MYKNYLQTCIDYYRFTLYALNFCMRESVLSSNDL